MTVPFFLYIIAHMKDNFCVWHRFLRGARGKAIAVLALLLLCLVALFSCSDPQDALLKSADISEEFKTEYFVGEAFSPSGELKIPLDGGGYEAVPIGEEMVSGFDTSSPGDILVTIRLGEYQATALIHVSELKASSITLDEETLPAVFYLKRPFPSGVTITAKMSDGSTRTRVPVTAQMLGGFDASSVGFKSITVSYLGASTTFAAEVKEDVRVSIAPIGAKTEYGVGDPLILEGAHLDVTYESGKVTSATLTENLVTGFRTDLGGTFTAKITYNGLECDYAYTVIKRALSLTLSEDTLPALYDKEDPFPTTGRATIVYDDGTTKTVELSAENAANFTTETYGDKTIDITIDGVSASYSYVVRPAIVMAEAYGFTPSVMKGTAFDEIGKLIVRYESGERDDIPFKGDDRLTIDYSTDEEGDVTQKVTFRGQTFSFIVHVYPESELGAVDHLEVAGAFRTIKKGDPLDVSGVQVYIVYKHLEPESVAMQPEWVSAELPQDFEGDYVDVPVTISCFGAQCEGLSVRVLSPEYAARVTRVIPFGFRTFYAVGEEFDPTGATLTAFYGGGYRVQNGVRVEMSYISGFDTTTAGDDREMTVTYGDCAVTVAYRVVADDSSSEVTDLAVPNFDPLLFVGDDPKDIDVSRYEVIVTLGHGYDSLTVPLTAEMLSGDTFTAPGRQSIILTYETTQKTIFVTVYPVEDKDRVTAISANGSMSADVGFAPDLSSATITVTYGHGYSTQVIPLDAEGVTVDPVSGDKAGLAHTTVHYGGCECGLSVNFVEGDGGNILDRVEIAEGSATAFHVGDAFGGVRLLVYYKDGTSLYVDATAAMANGFDTNSASDGVRYITITYGGRGVLYGYTVND